MYQIYMIVNQTNGKIYIGQTCKTLHKRWINHVALSKNRDYYFCKAIRKYGPENFIVKQIDVAKDRAEADELEKAYIGIFRSHIGTVGYNSTMGGEGAVFNEEARRRISLRNVEMWKDPEHKEKVRQSSLGKNPCYGGERVYTAERREAISKKLLGNQFRKGIPHTEETKTVIREAGLGEKNPFYGKKHTEESKRKIKEARSRQIITEEAKENMRLAHKRRKTTKEANLGKSDAAVCRLDQPPADQGSYPS